MTETALPADAYCGPPPLPRELTGSWNFDPFLIVALVAAALAGMRMIRSVRGRVSLGLALAVLVIAFVSPLCALSSSLFSARSAHHVLMISLAAPLLAFALPRAGRGSVTGTAVVHTAVLWLWHVPGFYALALSDSAFYWLMELSLLLSAVAFWRSAFSARDGLAASAGFLAIMMQMSLLGALLTFAQDALYTPHFGTTLAWGMSPLTDQQLAGLIMWVPGALPYLVAGILALRPVLLSSEETAR